MRREIGVLTASTALLLGACGMDQDSEAAGPRLSACEQLGAPVNPNIDAPHGITEDIGDYVIKLALDKVADNSITGRIVEFVEVEDQDVCRRFNNRGIEKPLQLHGNYNTDSWSNSRKHVAVVVDHGEAVPFLEAQPALVDLVNRQPGIILTVIGDQRESYTGSDDYGANYEDRDVAYQIDMPLR